LSEEPIIPVPAPAGSTPIPVIEEKLAEVVPTEIPVEVPAEVPTEVPAEVPAEETPVDKDAELDVTVWGDTGSQIGNDVLAMLQNSGVSTADAKALLYDAVEAGDITKIDQAALAEKVGKHAAAIIMSGTKSFIAESATKNAASVQAVHDAAGGKDNWDKAAKWASTSIEESVLAEYRPMIDKGGPSARFAVGEILKAYNSADGNTTLVNAASPRAEATATTKTSDVGTTRAEYTAALEKAERTKASPQERARIQAARVLGRKQGK
jgi:hypothetical protein